MIRMRYLSHYASISKSNYVCLLRFNELPYYRAFHSAFAVAAHPSERTTGEHLPQSATQVEA